MLCDTILAHECEEQVSVKIGGDIGCLQAGLMDNQLDHRYAVSMRMLGPWAAVNFTPARPGTVSMTQVGKSLPSKICLLHGLCELR